MLTFNHGPFARIAGLACAALVAAGGLALTPVRADTPETVSEVKEVKVFRILGDGKDRKHDSSDMHARLEKCEGERVEATADGAPGAGKKEQTRIILCGKPGQSKAQMAESLEKAVTRIEADSDMAAANKTEILAKLRAKIAELRAQ